MVIKIENNPKLFEPRQMCDITLTSRWGDYNISRPSSDEHWAKLLRRIKTFVSEAFVEKRESHEGWTAQLEKIV